MDLQFIDENIDIKKIAGIDRLNDFVFESEVELICQSFGLNIFDYLDLNDIYVTRLLQKRKISLNFEKKFQELKFDKEKRKAKNKGRWVR